jgi:transposase
VNNCIPEEAEAKICFDRFHVAQHFGAALDNVRAQEHRGLLAYEWQKNASRVDNRSRRDFHGAVASEPQDRPRLWRIKETAALLWDYSYRSSAKKAWKRLLGWISRCRLQPMQSGAY